MRAAFLLCLLLTGCLGGTQNPSYFPYYLPTEDVIRTHAKPVGLGYFKNFDPKACRIEVAPAAASNPTRTQVVLIATVVDKDGDARRKRRVEWQIEGPGTIVEVDESGYLPGRGYQITDKFAVSYSDIFPHTITRGNDNPRDDFTVCAGQTWCVISSPVAGETIVTAYAPEVYDWDKRRAFAKLLWNDGGPVQLPGPVRSGRETDSTLLERAKADAVPAAATPSLRLDATLPKTVAVNREVTATVTLINNGKTNSTPATVHVLLPANVDLSRTEPGPSRRNGSDLYWTLDPLPGGASKEITLVLKPTKAGAFSLAASADTQDGLTASTKADSFADTAGISVSVVAPKFSAAGNTTDVAITVSNSGNVPIENAVAWVTPGAGLRAETSPLELKVGSVPPGQSRSVTATLNAEQTGSVRVDVAADGGLAAHSEGTVTVGKAELTVRVIGPATVPVGDTATYEVQVANASDLSASNVVVDVNLPKGMAAKSVIDGEATTDGAAWKLATLAPGEKQVLRFTAAGNQPSELGSITATVNGSLASGGKLPAAKSTAPASVHGQPVLVMDVQAPSGPVSAGNAASYRIVLSNRGTSPATSLSVTADLSAELRPVRGTPNGILSSTRVSFDRLGDLPAGASITLTVDTTALTPGDARVNVTVQSKELPSPLKEEQATRITSK